MRDRVLAVLVTLVVFSTGFLAGLWAERHRPVPPPPAAFMAEFSSKPSPVPGAKPETTPKPVPTVNRAQLLEQISKIRPEVEAFRAKTAEIYHEFDRDMDTVLAPQQQRAYEEKFQSHRTFFTFPGTGKGDAPLTDEQIEDLMQQPLRTMTYFVVIPMTLEVMTHELKLDDVQHAKVRDFLRIRREKFIELLDSAQPPSLMLSQIAPLAQRIGAAVKGPTPTPQPTH